MEKRREIDCTLLIPRDLIGHMTVPLRRTGNMIEWLLLRSGHTAGGRRSGDRLTTRYQRPESPLRKVNFRVHPVVWHQLGCFARVHGVSRCLAFVMLLRAYASGQTEGTPPETRKRFYLLYYELVKVVGRPTTISRRRKYIDDALEARSKRIVREAQSRWWP